MSEIINKSLTASTHGHDVIDADAVFKVDAVTRAITTDKKEIKVIKQGDHNAEKFTFEIPRYIEGHDMYLCNSVQVHFLNIETNKKGENKFVTGVYTVNDFQLKDDETLTCSWLLSKNATVYAGNLSFMISLSCLTGINVDYRWITGTYSDIYITDSLNANLSFEEQYVDVIEQWKASVKKELYSYIDFMVSNGISTSMRDLSTEVNNQLSEITENLNADLLEYESDVNKAIDTHKEEVSGSVDEIRTYTQNNINTFDDILKKELKDQDDEINVLKSRMDGFTNLPEGSTTGDAELADIRVGANGITYDNAGTAVREQIKPLLDIPDTVGTIKNKTDIFTSNNLFNEAVLVRNIMFNHIFKEVETTSYSYFKMILPPGSYSIFPKARFVYNKTDNTILGTEDDAAGDHLVINVETESEYYITMYNLDEYRWKMYDSSANECDIMPYGTFTFGKEFLDPNTDTINNMKLNKVNKKCGKNILNLDNLEPGFINSDTGVIMNSDNKTYYTTEFIPVKTGEPISFSNVARKFLAYNNAKEALPETFVVDGDVDFTFIPTEDGYVRYSIQDKYLNMVMISYTESYIPYSEYEPFYYIMEEDVRLSESQIEEIKDTAIPLIGYQNVLYGKKWVACGDSFTHGGSEGTTKFENGLYAGKNKVYPYFIGNRNYMNVVNLAVGGQTMCNIDGNRENAFSNELYKNIPADADYITLKFGINDVNYDSPLGDIDDTDTTTFYGAYNTVMEYILTNHPYAKVGIIVTNGCNSNSKYTEATRKIARKWGIPTLDEAADYNVPLLHRVGEKTDICQKAIDIRLAAFRVSETDTHPNDKAHEYESTIVENWLRSL
jgi:lysophospholipase L1-like esterase